MALPLQGRCREFESLNATSQKPSFTDGVFCFYRCSFLPHPPKYIIYNHRGHDLDFSLFNSLTHENGAYLMMGEHVHSSVYKILIKYL